MRLVIIDDDPIYRLIASKMLKLIDSALTIEEYENGEIGLAGLKNNCELNQQIIVLVDINMPVLNGWGFLEKLQENNFYNLPHLHVYLVSSSTDKNDLLQAERFDFVKGFIHKPLSKENIENLLLTAKKK